MRWCPKCQHPAEAGSRFCSRCGEVLPHRRCDSCGTANEVDAWRCVECGQALRSLARPAPQPDPVDETAANQGPLARLAEFIPPPVSRPVPGASGRAPASTVQALPMVPAAPSGQREEHLSAAAMLAAEALRSAQVIVPEVFERPAPSTPPELRRPTPAAPALPPHLAATLQSIARAVAETPAEPPAAASPRGMAAAAGGAATPPVSSLPGSLASPGTVATVDLYLDVAAPDVQHIDIPLAIDSVGTPPAPAPGASPMAGPPAVGGAAQGRPGALGRPLMAGAIAGLVLAVVIGLAMHWKRLAHPEGSPASARPALEREGDRLGMPPVPAAPGRDPSSTASTLPQATSSRGAAPGASAASRRGPGVDAAADAALEAAERLLSAPPPAPGVGASAPPRPAGRGG